MLCKFNAGWTDWCQWYRQRNWMTLDCGPQARRDFIRIGVSFVVMAPELCLEGTVVNTTKKFSDRKIWQIGRSAINLSVTKSSGLLLPPRFPAMADLDR